jgi:hypothetical protein
MRHPSRRSMPIYSAPKNQTRAIRPPTTS